MENQGGECMEVGELTASLCHILPVQHPASFASTAVVIKAGGILKSWAPRTLTRALETIENLLSIFTPCKVKCRKWNDIHELVKVQPSKVGVAGETEHILDQSKT